MEKKLFVVLLLIIFVCITLLACNDADVKIEFVVDGEIVYNYESKKDLFVIRPENLVKDGYAILSWYKDEACTEEWNFEEEKITGNIKIYSKWIPIAEISAAEIINNGIFEVYEKILSVKVSYSIETFSITNNIEVSTYASYKIYKDSHCTEEVKGDITLVNGENIYYIKVVSKDLTNTNIYTARIYRNNLYSVVYKYNNDQDHTIFLVEEGKKLTSLIPDAKEGYTFVGWGHWNFEEDVITENIVFNAVWTPNNYNIVYENTYDFTNNNPNNYTIESDTITLYSLIGRTGYTFLGWYTAESGGEQVINIEKGSIGNKVLYARWQLNTYKVFLDNGEIITATYGEEYNLGIAEEKEGNTFIGWYTDADIQLTDAYGNSLAVWNYENNVNAYAKYIKNIYKVEVIGYDGNTESINISYGDSLDLDSLIPARSGYSFVGFYLDIQNNNPLNITVMPAYNLVIYQKWAAYNLNFNYDNKTAVSVNDTINAKLFNAVVTDTDGENKEVTATVIGEQIAGNTISVRLIANGKYGVTKQVTINDIKVYGDPTLTYYTGKDYFSLTDTLNANLWYAYGEDSFGYNTTINVYVEEQSYKAGDMVTIVIESIDAADNITTARKTGVKVYDKPKIIYNEEKTAISINDRITLKLWNVSAVDTFGKAAYVYLNYYPYPETGITTEIAIMAYDYYGYSNEVYFTVKIYGAPEIKDPTKTDFGINDEISVESLGLTALDSFGDNVNDITIALLYGEKVAGEELTYKVTATDFLGNFSTKEITVKIYGMPELDCEKTKISYADDLTNPNTFGFSGKDSFNNPITVSVALKSGIIEGGQKVVFTVNATDKAGNMAEKDFEFVVYSADDIKINYYPGATDSIKVSSKGEEFNASAIDSLGNPCDITIAAINGVLEGGNVVNIVLRATDVVGNYKDTNIINNIKLYDTITITAVLSDLYLRPQDDINLLFICKDSFGDEIGARFKTINETEFLLVVEVGVEDAAGNTYSKVYETNKIQNDQSVLYMYKDNEYIGAETVTLGSEYSLKCEPGYTYTWRLNKEQITDTKGESLNVWTKYGLWYKVNAEVKIITYKITYNLDGGVNNTNNTSSYTVVSLGGTEGTIDLLAPTKADKKELLSYQYLVTNEYENTILTTSYTFAGWYKEDTYNNQITMISFQLGSATLYAKWISDSSSEKIIQPYARINDDNTPNFNGSFILFGEFQQSILNEDVTIIGESDRPGYYLGSDDFYYAKGKNDYYKRENYFKVEPIKWRILQESNGTALLHCDIAVENIKFDSTSNIYEESDIRLWLNNNFYNNAFNSSQKEKVQPTQLENNIADNVFILSHSELMNAQYGFAEHIFADTARERKASDYAEFVGGLTEGAGECVYWSRTAVYNYVRYCTPDGNISPVEKPYSYWLCVVPALRIQLS